MSNKVKVCAFSPKRASAADQEAPEQSVRRMKQFWKQNLDKVVPARPDLIVLPEGCDIPKFAASTMSKQERLDAYLSARGEEVQTMLCEIAAAHRCYIAYSTKWRESGGVRNSTRMIDRSGKVMGEYTKWYNTIEEMRHGAIAGTELPVFECDFGTVAAIICYDMMFDDIRLEAASAKPDILIFSSAVSYGLMANLWAFTCRSYLVSSVFETGADIYSPLGDRIAASTSHNDHALHEINLDRAVVQRYPLIKIGDIRQKYGDHIMMEYPVQSEVNSLLLTSESPSVTAETIVREFAVSTLDDRLSRTVKLRDEWIGSHANIKGR